VGKYRVNLNFCTNIRNGTYKIPGDSIFEKNRNLNTELNEFDKAKNNEKIGFTKQLVKNSYNIMVSVRKNEIPKF